MCLLIHVAFTQCLSENFVVSISVSVISVIFNPIDLIWDSSPALIEYLDYHNDAKLLLLTF